ncbi:ATP-binding cassette sub- A member 1 [Mortierella alpina]|uniref:ATP-binding cassette sub- A member 1 n=1 Tax=Mortierella alpina TaxID=64518 RepID=A0A9P6JHF3_MORAP|nr:ATP-binding cassette sub- A member 1 [Mortierella alpina]
MSREHTLQPRDGDSRSHHSNRSQHSHQHHITGSTVSTPSTAAAVSSPIVFATARPSSGLGRWFRQLGVVCRLNSILLIRYWKAALLQAILLPLLVVGIIFGAQKASTSGDGKVNAANNAVQTWKMDGLYQCKPEPLSNACMTLVYAPQDAETTQIMNYFQTKNQERTNAALTMEGQVWQDMASVPSNNMGIVPMPSDKFIYDYALAHPDTIKLGVVFTKEVPASGPVHWNYQVWYNMSQAVNMSTVPGFKYTKEAGVSRESSMDDAYGVQLPNMIRALDESLLTFLDPAHQQADLDYSLKSFPTASSKNKYNSKDNILFMLSNILALPASITMAMAMLRVAREKENKNKESMQMMGLSPVVYWSAQWLTSWIMALIQGSVIVVLGYAFGLSFFRNTNWFVLWCMFVLLAYGMTLFGFFLTTFCQKSGTALAFGFAVVVAVLIVVPILGGPYWSGMWVKDNAKTYTWIVSFFFPPLHFARLFGQIAKEALGRNNETTGEYIPGPGFFFSNLTNYRFDGDDADWADYLPLPVSGLTYYGITILLLSLLTLYFDQVMPNEHGHSSGLFFFFGSIGKLFRFIRYGGSAGVARQKSADAQRILPYEGIPPQNEDSDVVAERERAVNCQSQVAIRISNLTKVYTKNGPGFFKNLFLALCCCCSRQRRRSNKIVNKAVDRLNMLTEPDELFALLGQNGAGKSTTMQMLYGVTDPDSGDAFLFNRSIRTDMQAIRASMGVCPQHDILFNDLSCWEHMQLYAGIKDLPAEALVASFDEKESIKENMRERPSWIRSRLEAVQLWKDRDTMAGRLSGGMKRRLSTIISTIGDPTVLILDEPTTGMDPIHRRHVWTFLAQFKRGRSILLTTHSMEEADALGDKVAIMVSGHLKAIGNTTRLKNKFGNGYRVEMALGNFIPSVQDPAHQQQPPQGRNLPSQKQLEQEMTDATLAIIPQSTLLDQSGGVMVFGIPMNSIERMADLTAMLERCQAQGKIKQWGIAQTSLEEVFLSLIRGSEDRH